MSSILVIDSAGVSGEASVSKALVREAVAALTADTQADVVYRDLGRDPIPAPRPKRRSLACAASRSPRPSVPRAPFDALIAELRAADTIVIGAPMYNFSVATGLRAWFDYVLRAGQTFRYSEAGPEGLLTGKRVIVVESRGGLYSEGPAQAADFQEPYLVHLLAFVGLTDVTFVRAEKIGYGPEAWTAAITAATASLKATAEGFAQAA